MSSTTLPHPTSLRQDVSPDNRLTGDSNRLERALELLDAGAVVPDGGPGLYYVQSQTGARQYHVNLTANTCTCPDYAYRHARCKHLEAARLLWWEQHVCQLCEQAGISLQRLQDKILANVVMNDYATAAQREALDAIERVWQRRRAQGGAQ